MNAQRLMKYLSFLFPVLMLMTESSCLINKSLTGNNTVPGPGDDSSMDATLDQLSKTQVPYTWFAGSGKGRIDWDGERYSVRFNVRILRDSIIWMQISKLGFEVGRMYVTPDSAFFINRLEHSYSIYKTADFLKAYNVPADFDMFSRVFTAGAYIPPYTTEVDKADDGSVIMHGGTGVTVQHWFDASVLSKSNITDANDHEWTAGFSEYQVTPSGQSFPYLRTNVVRIDGQANVFDLEYASVIIDIPQEFPFSIPSHYEKQ